MDLITIGAIIILVGNITTIVLAWRKFGPDKENTFSQTIRNLTNSIKELSDQVEEFRTELDNKEKEYNELLKKARACLDSKEELEKQNKKMAADIRSLKNKLILFEKELKLEKEKRLTIYNT